jgi:hypothetical protein
MAISMNVVTKLAIGRQWYAELTAIGDCTAFTAERSSDPLGAASSMLDVSELRRAEKEKAVETIF